MIDKIEFHICGQERELAVNYEAIKNIESVLGCGYLKVVNELDQISVVSMAQIMHIGMKAGGGDPALKVSDVGQDIIKQGVAKYFKYTIEYLTAFNSKEESTSSNEGKS